MLNIILFGPPGSGKGTQSTNLLHKYELEHISTGDLLRSEVALGTPLGVQAKAAIDQGLLVSDEIVIGMISQKIDEKPNAKGYIFDGFPRTKQQAEALDNLLQSKNLKINIVLALDVPDTELTQRILHRALTSGRSDDNEEIVKKRIEEYRSKTAVVASYYAQRDLVKTIDGIGDVDDVFQKLVEAINKI